MQSNNHLHDEVVLCILALGKGLHDVSFNRPASRGSFGQSPLPQMEVLNQLNCSLDQSLNQSWIFYNYTAAPTIPVLSSIESKPSYANNPNKAVLTIDARTTEVTCTSFLFDTLPSCYISAEWWTVPSRFMHAIFNQFQVLTNTCYTQFMCWLYSESNSNVGNQFAMRCHSYALTSLLFSVDTDV